MTEFSSVEYTTDTKLSRLTGIPQVLERKNNDLREQIHVLRQEKEQDRRQHERTVEDLRQDRDAWRAQDITWLRHHEPL